MNSIAGTAGAPVCPERNQELKFMPTPELPEVILVEPRVIRDERGFFLETWHEQRYREGGIPGPFVQDNCSKSVQRTLRGLHAQVRRPQGKLVRAVHGAMFDVAVDIRPGSPTFGRWVGATLTADNFHQLWIPPGFAHGFCVLSDLAEVEYKCTEVYVRDDEIAIAWDDPDIGIAWPVANPLLSPRDRAALLLTAARERLALAGTGA